MAVSLATRLFANPYASHAIAEATNPHASDAIASPPADPHSSEAIASR